MEQTKAPISQFIIAVMASVSITDLVKSFFSDDIDTVVNQLACSELQTYLNSPSVPQVLVFEYDEEKRTECMKVLSWFKHSQSSLFIIYVTINPNTATLDDELRSLVSEEIALPREQARLHEIMVQCHEKWHAEQKGNKYVNERLRRFDFSQIIGDSPQVKKVLDLAKRIMSSVDTTILILGETGTGKEMFAKAIHYNSKNSYHPFVEIDCSAIPEQLLESELFGHEKGAYTDAKSRKKGLFEIAGEGTIFLDEIGDIGLSTQSKLLRVLEEKSMRRVGGVEDIPMKARIIAATSKDLDEMLKAGGIRKDLYYRLKVFPLELPPLRERDGDITLLAEYFLAEFSSIHGVYRKGFTERALENLNAKTWEGNVRELKHVIERAVFLSNHEWIDERDLGFPGFPKPSNPEPNNKKPSQVATLDEDHITLSFPIKEASADLVEKLLAREVLIQTGGDKRKAAEILRISRPRLNRLIREDPEFFKKSDI
jgi:two-component system, NtrC family, response regulator AtoC